MPICNFGVQLCWLHQCSTCHKSEIMLHSSADAEQWLASFVHDPLVTISLHEISRECCGDRLRRFSDRDAIRMVALQLASGWLRACDQNWTVAESQAFTNDPAAGDSESPSTSSYAPVSKPFPIEERKPRMAPPPPSKPLETELLTFAENLNVQSQVASMQAAAAQAIPFCAVCSARTGQLGNTGAAGV